MTAGAITGRAPRAGARDRVEALRQFLARHAFASMSPAPMQRIGAEIEFLAVSDTTGRVAALESGDGGSTLGAVRSACRRYGWAEGRSAKGAPWFCLPSGGRVTFEPGGQVEYASPPYDTATALLEDLRATASTLRAACAGHGIRLLDCGLDPINGPDEAPLQIRALRYRRMDGHFARIGAAGARMMRQTASLHVALDVGMDALGRWRLLNGLAPVLTAMFANSRRYAGTDTGCASYRAETWRRTDSARTGLLAGVDPVGEYVDFALRAPAFLLGAEDEPAKPLESWLDAIDGPAAWNDHLGTLFPEIRPRGYFEVRSTDALPDTHWPAVVAFLAGLTYDCESAGQAAEIVREPDTELLERAGRAGLGDPKLAGFARDLAEVALRGCARLGHAFLSERHFGEAADVLSGLTR